MKWNKYMETQFAECRLLLTGFDEHRKRTVEVHALPGEFEYLGFCDGTDAWVVPINASSELAARGRAVLEAIRAGRDPEPANAPRRRKLLLDDVVVEANAKAHSEEAIITRRRLYV